MLVRLVPHWLLQLTSQAAKFNKARRFVEGVLRSKEDERLSLRRCRKEAAGPGLRQRFPEFSKGDTEKKSYIDIYSIDIS